MTRVTIEVKATEALRAYARSPGWRRGSIKVFDDRVIVDGTVKNITDAIWTINRMGLIDSSKSDRMVFAAYDPNGDRHQITSKDYNYSFCVAYRENGDAILKHAMEIYSPDSDWREDFEENLETGVYLPGVTDIAEFSRLMSARLINPIKAKLADGGFQKYITKTHLWTTSRADADACAARCRTDGHLDVVVLSCAIE